MRNQGYEAKMAKIKKANLTKFLGSVDALQDKRTEGARPVRDAKTRRLRLRRGITMDSGAANNVMPRRMVRNKMLIRPSAGSIKRAHYIAANGGKIPNEGEFDFEFKTTDDQKKSLVFQVADVNKALGSISYLVGTGHRVTFDKDMATGKDLSLMYHKESKTAARFRRERNIWVLDALIDAEDEDPSVHRHA